MARAFILYNPLAGNGRCTTKMQRLIHILTDEMVYCDVTADVTYTQRLLQLETEDYIVVCGGDGTLNRFANSIADVEIPNDILYFPCGSGNDFAKDVEMSRTQKPFSIKRYLQNLPTVEVDGDTYRFLNGVGLGLDGHCIAQAELLRTKSHERINYKWLALKALLFQYTPTNATVTVDGVTRTYEKVWLVPTMLGRLYGGGVMPAPAQNRLSDTLTVMVAHDLSKLRILALYPTIMKGKHVRHTRYIEMLEGKQITVSFDRPCAMQIDGEPLFDVRSYTARAGTVKQSNFTDEKVICNLQ